MRNPFQILKHEHRIIECGLRALDGVCTRLDRGERLSGSLAELMKFFNEFADGFHHAKEDRYLFPLLEEKGVLEPDARLAIKGEHHREHELTSRMEAAVQALGADPDSLKPRKEFIEAGREYLSHLVKHMQTEESLVFRIVEQMLDEDDLERLTAEFSRAEVELGPGGSAAYHDRAVEMEMKWSV